MSWGLVAVAGTSLLGAHMSKKSSDKAIASAEQSSAEQLAFDKERYADWQEIYGPMQENLAEYYANLTPEFYEVTGVRNINKELQDTLQAINTRAVQSGVSTKSGITQSLQAQANIAAAEARAEVRATAPRAVAEDKTRFLQIGLGQNPAQSVANTLAQRTQSTQNLSLIQQQAAGQAIGSAVNIIGTGLSDYFNKKPTTGAM